MVDLVRDIVRILLSIRQDPASRQRTIAVAVVTFLTSFLLVYLTQWGHFFGLSFITVVLLAWLGGWRLGLAVGVAIPLLSIPLGILMEVPFSLIVIDVLAFGFMLVLTGGAVGLLSTMFGHLVSTQRELKLLYQFLPICSHCHRIRQEDQQWISLEAFFNSSVGTRFTNGVCPSCIREHYPGSTRD